MTKNSILKKLRKFHKWPGIVITLFVILFSLSGIFMNHRDLISAIDINRSLLPEEYSYQNWNKGAVKSVFQLSPDSALVYGNIGVWLTTDHFKTFQDWNAGFPDGSDNRKISKMLKTTMATFSPERISDFIGIHFRRNNGKKYPYLFPKTGLLTLF